MAAFLKIAVLVLILSTSVYFVHSHSISSVKDGGMFTKFESIEHVQDVQPTVATEDPDNKAINPMQLNLDFLRSLLQKEQIRAERIKRNKNTKGELVSSTSRPNGSTTVVKGGDHLNGSPARSTVSCKHTRGRRQSTHPCVKRIVKTYHIDRDEIVTEYACWKASLYCPQTPSRLGRCQPIKTFHGSLGKILTVGCKCKP